MSCGAWAQCGRNTVEDSLFCLTSAGQREQGAQFRALGSYERYIPATVILRHTSYPWAQGEHIWELVLWLQQTYSFKFFLSLKISSHSHHILPVSASLNTHTFISFWKIPYICGFSSINSKSTWSNSLCFFSYLKSKRDKRAYFLFKWVSEGLLTLHMDFVREWLWPVKCLIDTHILKHSPLISEAPGWQSSSSLYT